VSRIILVFCSVCIIGCSSVPFKRAERARLEGIDPQEVRLRFAKALPQKFDVMNSIVFAYHHRKISCLGPTRVDIPAQGFTVVGLNHVGVTLFELLMHNGRVEPKYIFPELAARGDFATAVSEDIKRIYFERVPPPESKMIPGKYAVIFRAPKDGGFLEYVFAGRDRFLVEKSYYVNGRKLWSVSYYEYASKEGKIFPAGIMVRHYRYDYRLTVRLKEIRESE
jgi:hypothetical protein